MANAILAVAIENEVNNGSVIAEGGKFNKAVRSMDAGDPLMEGDTIAIPEDYTVLTTIIGKDRDGNDNIVPYIMVTVTSADDKEKAMRFFPNQLAKIVFPVDEDGKRLPKVKTTGTAAKHFAGFQEVDEAMESLKGKSIKVVKDDTYRTSRLSDGAIVNTHIYQYDLV